MAICSRCGESAGYGRARCQPCESSVGTAPQDAALPTQPWQVPKRVRRVASKGSASGTTSGIETPPLRIAGGIVLAAGVLGVVFALRMDTTVEAGIGGLDRVNNIGLLNDRLAYLAAGGVAAIVGAILVVATVRRT